MRKIYFYSIATHLGGAERSLLTFLIFLQKSREYLPTVILPRESGPLVEELKKNNISFTVLPLPKALLRSTRHGSQGRLWMQIPAIILALTWYLPRLASFIRRSQADLVYSTGIKCHLLIAIATLLRPTPILWHLRDYFSPGVTRSLMLFLARLPWIKIVANSKATALSLPSKSDIGVVYNGIEPKDFPFCRSNRIRDQLKIAPNCKIIGIVGVLARWKGQKQFLQMAAELLKKRSDLFFVIIGDQIYDTAGDANFKEELVSLTQTMQIESQVSFLGFRTDNAESIQSLDILVHASIAPEPFGRTLIEALACGTPISASDQGGPREIIEHGKTGLLHQMGNVDSMVKNIEQLLEDEALCQKIVQQGHSHFLQNFTADLYTKNLLLQLNFAMADSNSKTKPAATAG